MCSWLRPRACFDGTSAILANAAARCTDNTIGMCVSVFLYFSICVCRCHIRTWTWMAHVQYYPWCQVYRHTHHEIRAAGTLGRCLTTGWGRPKVGAGLDIEPHRPGPNLSWCRWSSAPLCSVHPCFFLLARTGLLKRQRREERGGGRGEERSKRRGKGEKTEVGHRTVAK